MVAAGKQRSVLRSGTFTTRLLSSRFRPPREPIVEEALQPEVVLEMVLSHTPDENGEAAMYKPIQLLLMCFELPYKVLVVHVL